MDFADRLQALAKLIEKQNTNFSTQEATKNAFVIPFIQALGYDVFDPAEVLPRFTPHGGRRQDEKVDYAVFIEGKPALLFACKPYGQALNKTDTAQLGKCFKAATAWIGVLTNGKSYYFYSNFEGKNLMNDAPFLEFNLLDINEQNIVQLSKISKASILLNQVFAPTNELNYVEAVKTVFLKECSSPSMEFVRFFADQMHSGIETPQVLDHFALVVKQAFREFIEENVDEHLKSVRKDQGKGGTGTVLDASKGFGEKSPNDVVITDEEFESFFIVSVT